MREYKFLLTALNPKKEFTIDPENPQLAIEFDGAYVHSFDDTDSLVNIEIKSLKRRITETKTFTIDLLGSEGNQEIHFPSFNDNNISKIEISLVSKKMYHFGVNLIIKSGRPLITIENPLEEFDKHFSNRGNTKIVFSAPFGDGKTTFLDYFFDKQQDKYEVFKVFPVNYSVASNEDIFKYIKADILSQLLGKDLEWEKEEFSKGLAIESYVYFNPRKAVVSFLKLFSSLEKKTELLGKVVLGLQEILEEAEKYREQIENDDQKKAIAYIESIYKEEGSLFEDNFYTQLIRQLLGRLRENSQKETVLIIEDLDRMDPEHVFRIFNVISAHYDTYKYVENEISHNKFGFDKIIVVCDVKNIRSIFEHRYGEKADFDGYFNKFFSSKVYHYDNAKSILLFVEMIYKQQNSRDEPSNPYNEAHIVILKSLISGNQLKLRDFIKIMEILFKDFQVIDSRDTNIICKGNFTKSLAYLASIFSIEDLIKKIEVLKKKNVVLKLNYYIMSTNLLAALGVYSEMNKLNVKYNNLNFEIGYKDDFHFDNFTITEILSIKDFELNDLNPKMDFNHIDFYNLLIETILKYDYLKTKMWL